MEMLGRLFTVLMLVAAGSGFRWSDKLREDAGPLQVCSGDNIQLLWNFTLDRGERVKGMVWGCHPEGKEEDVLATYVDDHFVPMSSFSGRLAHLQDGGLELSCATILESGKYSIVVSTEGADNVLRIHRKTASVVVVDTPKMQSGEIHVTRNRNPVRDVTTGAWHVQLSYGNVSDRGHPPVDVIWTTPRGERLNSSSYEDGFFRLLVPNPPVGGNYCCSIPPSLPAVKCLARDSPLLDTVCVEVEETAARFSLIEARQQEILDELAVEKKAVQDMTNQTQILRLHLDEAVRNGALPVYFHARLSANIHLSNGRNLKLGRVISNQGGGYNPSTGQFTAPINGSYVFMGTTGSYSSSWLDSSGRYSSMQMVKEGTVVADTRSSSDSVGSCHAALYLNAGDKVWLQSSGSSYVGSSMTSFTGFRI